MQDLNRLITANGVPMVLQLKLELKVLIIQTYSRIGTCAGLS